jgi:hypothetical protein
VADVLLVGGSHDGETIRTRVSGSLPLVVHFAVARELAWRDDLDPSEAVPVETYSIVRLDLFGRTVVVGLGPGVTPTSAVQSMLSPAAFALWAKAEG